MFRLFLSVLFPLPSPHPVIVGSSFCHLQLCLTHSRALHTPVSFVKEVGWWELGDGRHDKHLTLEKAAVGTLLWADMEEPPQKWHFCLPSSSREPSNWNTRTSFNQSWCHPRLWVQSHTVHSHRKSIRVHRRAHRVVYLPSPQQLQSHISNAPYYVPQW